MLAEISNEAWVGWGPVAFVTMLAEGPGLLYLPPLLLLLWARFKAGPVKTSPHERRSVRAPSA